MANHTAYFAIRAEMDAKRDAERVASYISDPEGYLARRALAGLSVTPPRGAEHIQVRGRVNQIEPNEPEMREIPGYRLHLAKDAIVDAFLELRAERQRTRPNTDERDAIKDAYSPIFQDVGLRLVKIPNWVRRERTIMEARLR